MRIKAEVQSCVTRLGSVLGYKAEGESCVTRLGVSLALQGLESVLRYKAWDSYVLQVVVRKNRKCEFGNWFEKNLVEE